MKAQAPRVMNTEGWEVYRMKHAFFPFAMLVICVALLGATNPQKSAPAMQLPPGVTAAQMKLMMTPLKVHPATMPAGTVGMMGCIPTMGYHYVSPKNWPFGPIYGFYNGKATFTEIMVAKKLFEQGGSWNNLLKPLPGYKIDHVDIWYEAHGHPGYEVPHYDIHAWYISASQYMYFCGNTSGQKPAWL